MKWFYFLFGILTAMLIFLIWFTYFGENLLADVYIDELYNKYLKIRTTIEYSIFILWSIMFSIHFFTELKNDYQQIKEEKENQ